MRFLLTYRGGHACTFYSRTEVGMHALFTHVQKWACMHFLLTYRYRGGHALFIHVALSLFVLI